MEKLDLKILFLLHSPEIQLEIGEKNILQHN